MTFLTDSPDFDGWIYSTEDLVRARDVLLQLLERVAPEWLEQPGGYIAKQWHQGGLVPVSILIDLAHTLYRARKGITSKSVPVFETKVRQMMWAEQRDQYQELLTEFQIVAELSQHVSPISIEPLVAKEESGGPEQPPSPDLGVLLPEGLVLLEVTVSRFEFLREWHRAVDELSRRITHEIGKVAAKLSFRLDFPLGFQVQLLEESSLRHLLKRVGQDHEGRHVLPFQGGEGLVAWKTLRARPTSGAGERLSKISISWPTFRLRLDSTLDDKVERSFMNTIRKKLRRWSEEAPFIVVVRPGDPWITADTLVQIAERRFWPNERFHRLSGLISFRPRQGYQVADAGPELRLSPNPNASWPVGASLESVFHDGRCFHYDRPSQTWRENL